MVGLPANDNLISFCEYKSGIQYSVQVRTGDDFDAGTVLV